MMYVFLIPNKFMSQIPVVTTSAEELGSCEHDDFFFFFLFLEILPFPFLVLEIWAFEELSTVCSFLNKKN